MDTSRRLHGRRGLKYIAQSVYSGGVGRRLHGRRGLKFQHKNNSGISLKSPPSRAAWIEISIDPEKSLPM